MGHCRCSPGPELSPAGERHDQSDHEQEPNVGTDRAVGHPRGNQQEGLERSQQKPAKAEESGWRHSHFCKSNIDKVSVTSFSRLDRPQLHSTPGHKGTTAVTSVRQPLAAMAGAATIAGSSPPPDAGMDTRCQQ